MCWFIDIYELSVLLKVVCKPIYGEESEMGWKLFPVGCCLTTIWCRVWFRSKKMWQLSVFSTLIWYIWDIFICQMCGQLFLVMQIILIKTVLFLLTRKQVFTEYCFVTKAYHNIVFFWKKLLIKHVVFNSLVKDVPLSTKYSS